MIKITEIYWLAGILEGEGCFRAQKYSPVILLGMTDYDVVSRVARIWGKEIKSVNRNGYKAFYRCSAQGILAVEWMMTLYPLMGTRRKAKIKEVLNLWRTSPRSSRLPTGKYVPKLSLCHPDQEHVGLGLCVRCYFREHSKKRRSRYHAEAS